MTERRSKTTKLIWCLAALGVAAPLVTAGAASAQSAPPSGYVVGDGSDTSSGTGQTGPVRLARFSYVQGNVTWRPDDGSAWSPAAINLPIRQGAQIWVTQGRAEVQFDDGSLLRLGAGAVVTLQTLYSDADGEFTELRLNQGLGSLRLLHKESRFQVDAPNVSIQAAGPAKVRFGVDDGVEIAVRQGAVTVEGAQNQTHLNDGDYLFVADESADFNVSSLPPADDWDRFNDDRDQRMDEAEHDQGRVPSSVALVAGDLDDYGSWHNDPRYGEVWAPRVTDADWRPYHNGHWVWVDPFGWTWVSSEAWGWAPYHYGTWVSEPYGWAWVPGPARQYWCPAVVHFCSSDGQVAWAPLAPVEVHYPPALSIGFHGGDWSLSFSIGGCAVYRPNGPASFAPRPWHNAIVNRVTNITNVTNVTVINNQPAVRPLGFGQYDHIVPVNARLADGVSAVGSHDFAGQTRFLSVNRASAPALFIQGHSSPAAGPGRQPLAGPGDVLPTPASRTFSRSFLPSAVGPRVVLSRPVFRSNVAPRIARTGAKSGTFVAPRPASIAPPNPAEIPSPDRIAPDRTAPHPDTHVFQGAGSPPKTGSLPTPRVGLAAPGYHIDTAHQYRPGPHVPRGKPQDQPKPLPDQRRPLPADPSSDAKDRGAH